MPPDRGEATKAGAKRALRALRAVAASPKAKHGDIEFALDVGPGRGLSDLLAAVGEAARGRGTAAVLFIDELQYVPGPQLASLVGALRDAAQARLPITMIAAGLPQLLARTGRAKSYAERLSEFACLDRLDETAAVDALCVPARQGRRRLRARRDRPSSPRPSAVPVSSRSGGKHCRNASGAFPIDGEDAAAAARRALAELDASVFPVRFDRLTPSEKSWMRAMAGLGPGPHRPGDTADKLGRKVVSPARIRDSPVPKGMPFGPSHGDAAFTAPLLDGFTRRIMPRFPPDGPAGGRRAPGRSAERHRLAVGQRGENKELDRLRRIGARRRWPGVDIPPPAWHAGPESLRGALPMSLDVAVQMDHVSTIAIQGDSTFALALEAQRRGHRLFHYTPDRLSLRGNTVSARVETMELREEQGRHFALGPQEKVELAAMDVVLLRQDPPFDMNYITSTHLLERVHPRTLVVNDPAWVRNAPEKIFVTEFPDLMPETLVTKDPREVAAFRAEFGEIVMKPLYGNGGAGVFHITKEDRNLSAFLETFALLFREPFVVQRYLKDVRRGDKRIILVEGEPVGAINRVPAETDARSNMHVGGRAEPTGLTEREREICARIGPALKERGLIFVGIDVIGDFLTEINVTSPTGIREVKRFGGADVAALVWDAIEARRG